MDPHCVTHIGNDYLQVFKIVFVLLLCFTVSFHVGKLWDSVIILVFKNIYDEYHVLRFTMHRVSVILFLIE